MTSRNPYALTFPAREAARIAITNVTVVPMDSERLIAAQTVVIERGRIHTLGPTAEVKIDGAVEVDGKGKFLMPGLADMHVHYGDLGDYSMFLATGVTLVRDMWSSPLHLAVREQVRRRAIPGPHVAVTSPLIDGPGVDGGTVWPASILLERPAEAAPLVNRLAARGYEQIKAYSWLTTDTLAALGHAAVEVGLRLTGHCPSDVTYEQAIEAGMSCFEHFTSIGTGHLEGGVALPSNRNRSSEDQFEALRLSAHHVDLDSIRRLAAREAAEEIWNCPTLVLYHRWGADTEDYDDPLLRYELPAYVTAWNPRNDVRFRHFRDRWSEWLSLTTARNETLRKILAIHHEEGAPLLLGTDTPNPFVFQGFSLHEELELFVSAGFTPYEALRCGTFEAARFLGQETVWGTVGEGQRADLLLTRANPLEDVSAVRDLDAVFVNGFYFLRGDLDALLERRVDWVRQPLPSTEIPDDTAADDHGTWSERYGGVETGRLSYRHRRSSGGGWFLEERYASGNDLTRRTSRLNLTSALDLIAGEIVTESAVGEERCDLRYTNGHYELRLVELDGHQSALNLVTDILLPSERLAQSAIPLLIRLGVPRSTFFALAIELGEARVLELGLAPAKHDAGCWQLRVDRPGEPIDQRYRLAENNQFLGAERMTWMGQWELVPEYA